MTDVYFFMGRLTYLIIYFDPIVESSLYAETPATFDLEHALSKYALG
jgi:hypothetical protein